MKYFIAAILALLLVAGCVTPDIPDVTPEPECLIVHEGGYYVAYFAEWKKCQCPSCVTYPAGTYWVNYDGTMFLIGEPVINATSVYGQVPDGCILIIEGD